MLINNGYVTKSWYISAYYIMASGKVALSLLINNKKPQSNHAFEVFLEDMTKLHVKTNSVHLLVWELLANRHPF